MISVPGIRKNIKTNDKTFSNLAQKTKAPIFPNAPTTPAGSVNCKPQQTKKRTRISMPSAMHDRDGLTNTQLYFTFYFQIRSVVFWNTAISYTTEIQLEILSHILLRPRALDSLTLCSTNNYIFIFIICILVIVVHNPFFISHKTRNTQTLIRY